MYFSMRTERGSIIAFTLLLLSILLTAGLSAVSVAALEKRSSLATQKSVVAFQAADSAAERVLLTIYRDNSPPLNAVALNGTMPDATLDDVANHLAGVVNASASCSRATNKIVATSSNDPAYTFEIAFLDGNSGQITCTDPAWRDKVASIKADGFFRQTSRVIELGIKPRPKCAATDTVRDSDNNSYGVILIGDQCWLDRNMEVGTWLPSGIPQTNNSTKEYYCYNDDASNCTTDGGLYTWDEAMDYAINAGARGICPPGWHIPTDEDWYYLENRIDPTINDRTATGWRGDVPTAIGTKLKPGGTTGLDLVLTGYRAGGNFSDQGSRAYYMSSSSSGSPPTQAWERRLDQTEARVHRDQGSTASSIQKPVRCVID